MEQQKQILPPLTKDLTPVQQGWLKLSGIKTETFAALEKGELEIQALLKDFTKMELVPLQEALKNAKAKAAIFKDQRLQFTNMINEKLVKPAMIYEGRNDKLIADAGVVELTLRKAAVAENDKAANLNKEKAALEAHIKNEFARIGTVYKNALTKHIGDAYVGALKSKLDPQQIPDYINTVAEQLAAITVEKPVKFARTLVDDNTAKAVLATITKYSPAADLTAAVDKLRHDTFAMYVEDLQNAEVAVDAIEQLVEEQVHTNTEEWKLEEATNTLMAQASEFTMTGGPTVKVQKKIVLEDTEEFAMNVLATFIKNWPTAKTKLGTKSWTKLVDPFVKALDKLETQFPNFKYEEKCK